MKYSTAFLIDDDMDDHDIFSYAMEKADKNVQCVFANDGVQALEKIRSEETFIPDYIFIDMNMPRMNGQQCLVELKKIDRLKSIPVFMYSTSADPQEIAENLKLGATDFIIKPSNVMELTEILGKIVKRNILPILMLLMSFGCITSSRAQEVDSVKTSQELKKLSVEALMNIVVTSVSKSPEKLSEVASAIQVVTSDEIRRSGSLRLPGMIRLATNMQVTTSGAHDIRITSRGFSGYPVANSSLANKLLVMIDGRSVYTPLFGGVYWDVQNVMQENVKQIEVISGPGGAIWGANAVNGIVNVITKSAKETQGLYASVAGGTLPRDYGAIQFGSRIDTTFYYRAYVQRFDYLSTTLKGGIDAKDAWDLTQGGFRADYYPTAKSNYTLEGDLYAGTEDDTGSTFVNGQNIIGRWNYNYSATSGLTVQAYFDRTFRNISSTDFTNELNTYDVDMQHFFKLGRRNKVVWGLGYRLAESLTVSQGNTLPHNRTLRYYTGFLQDQIAIVKEKLELTLGTKVLHNDYTGVEFHPTARLAWFPRVNHTVWGAVSQGVRTPSMFERDFYSPGLGAVGEFKSEKVIAYELGYRMNPFPNMSVSLSTFFNDYSDLRSVDTNQSPPPQLYFGNNLEAQTMGFELYANMVATRWWKIRGGYNWMHEDFTITGDHTNSETASVEAIDPVNQLLVQSMMDVLKNYQLDLTFRYVDVIPAAFSSPSVPSYFTFDARVAWHYKWLTLSVVGQNLAQKTHGSAGSIEIPRSGFIRMILRF